MPVRIEQGGMFEFDQPSDIRIVSIIYFIIHIIEQISFNTLEPSWEIAN